MLTFLAYAEYTFENYSQYFEIPKGNYILVENIILDVYQECQAIGEITGDKKICMGEPSIILETGRPEKTTILFYINPADPDFDRGCFKGATIHETIHILQYAYSKRSSLTYWPNWYSEGMAEGLSFYDQKKLCYSIGYATPSEYPSTLEELEEFFFSDKTQKIQTAYDTAAKFYLYLTEIVKKPEYHTLLLEYHTPFCNDFSRRFEEIFGKTAEEMYKEFLKKQNTPSPSSNY